MELFFLLASHNVFLADCSVYFFEGFHPPDVLNFVSVLLYFVPDINSLFGQRSPFVVGCLQYEKILLYRLCFAVASSELLKTKLPVHQLLLGNLNRLLQKILQLRIFCQQPFVVVDFLNGFVDYFGLVVPSDGIVVSFAVVVYHSMGYFPVCWLVICLGGFFYLLCRCRMLVELGVVLTLGRELFFVLREGNVSVKIVWKRIHMAKSWIIDYTLGVSLGIMICGVGRSVFVFINHVKQDKDLVFSLLEYHPKPCDFIFISFLFLRAHL